MIINKTTAVGRTELPSEMFSAVRIPAHILKPTIQPSPWEAVTREMVKLHDDMLRRHYHAAWFGVEWRRINDDYEVSNMGDVRSLDRVIAQRKASGGTYKRTMPGKLLKPQKHPKGYLFVWIGQNQCLVHRLVAEAFVPNPDNLPQVNHEDGKKTHNYAYNLKWTDNSGNQQHAMDTGLMRKARGSEVGNAKLTEDAVRWLKANPNMPSSEAAEALGVVPRTVQDIRSGRTWAHVWKD